MGSNSSECQKLLKDLEGTFKSMANCLVLIKTSQPVISGNYYVEHQDILNYHLEFFLIKYSTILDQQLLICNAALKLGFNEKQCKLNHLNFKRDMKKSSKLLYKMFCKHKKQFLYESRLRNRIVHQGSIHYPTLEVLKIFNSFVTSSELITEHNGTPIQEFQGVETLRKELEDKLNKAIKYNNDLLNLLFSELNNKNTKLNLSFKE
ncbi:Cthe_2314 family HEPN domain-containing protein [Bacillus velezensis]|uniref:Cthe_2314 family HEPN domain-containing protein n=1 Tax=Bacillus velezensis TaxID=492670 RepID=UPI003CF88AF6